MRCRSHKEDLKVATIYILGDDLNIQGNRGLCSEKTADIRQKVLIMPENFLKGVGEECQKRFCCWIIFPDADGLDV